MHLTVFVVDDDQAARESLTFLLRSEGLTARGYGSATAFLDQLEPDHQGCIVTDIRMPGMDGLALVHHLNRTGRRIPVVVITGHADVALAVQAMKAGAHDFIEKPFDSAVLVDAVRQCLEKSHSALAKETQRQSIDRRYAQLTERERQVCAAVVEGLSNKEIGLQLDISPRTVEIYRANVMSKMQAGSLSDLVKMMLLVEAA